MRVIALLSGGKDSVAAIEVAMGFGWHVVAGLRLLPSSDDSYMYHTPNLDAVEGVAQCLGIPLETAHVTNDPIQEVDETAQVLAKLREKYQLDGIISGALASEYQRTRLDEIGYRVGLKSFAPLWHKNPDTYMQSLVEGGYKMALSRVAAGGIGPDEAGSELDGAFIARLPELRIHPAGEGGEYESIVLDAPHYRRRLVVDEAELEASSSRGTWHIRRWHTIAK